MRAEGQRLGKRPRLKALLAPASENEENVGVERDAEAKVPPNSDTTQIEQGPVFLFLEFRFRFKHNGALQQQVSSGRRAARTHGEVTRLYERRIVLLHGNSFQRNLWSGALLTGPHITATTERQAGCRNTNALMNHPTCEKYMNRVFQMSCSYCQKKKESKVDYRCKVDVD